ncbi:hypothetical protein Sjap_019432 [Stephania japonica]|uniref:Cation/H+ exchanger transmembrane domain-containing protein n=1 Tax=Stephania japonica TaxID=461633 RepID=A0AAP0HUQ5_9MAGN
MRRSSTSQSSSSRSAIGLCFWFSFVVVVFLLCFVGSACSAAAVDEADQVEKKIINGTASPDARSKEESFANMIDRALEKEFPENEQTEETDPGSFNNSVADQQAVLETVARVKSKKNETKDKDKSFQLHDVFHLDNENRAEDTPTLIDRKDNVFIISNSKSKYPVLQLDLRLISDLVVVIVSATCGGIAFACAGQPVITGYLLAGSLIGPGGLSFVSEMVQVETVAQFGVIFLLFALGLEFSAAKLCGGKPSEGVFVGAFLSMSSTAVHMKTGEAATKLAALDILKQAFIKMKIINAGLVEKPMGWSKTLSGNSLVTAEHRMNLSVIAASHVLKFLMERNSISALHGQVTVGTLILQDCAVGLLFALLPVLCGTSGVLQGVISMTKSLVVLITFLAILSILCHTFLPWFLKLMISLSSQSNELYQLASVAFCLLVAWCSDKLGLSLELGSFAAGVMISSTDLAQHTLEQVEPIRNFFAALFLASIGMLIHVHFLWNHVDILLAAVILVGMSLAQIGEFAFVLLSRASNLHLVEGKLYLLLLGTTAFSLVTTPLLFKLIPAVVHLGVLLRWFSPDSSQNEIGYKGDILRTESAKRIPFMVQGSHDS